MFLVPVLALCSRLSERETRRMKERGKEGRKGERGKSEEAGEMMRREGHKRRGVIASGIL